MTTASPDRPTVAIVTPSFGQGRHLGAAIGSVLAQDYPDLEYLVVDGGSGDTSLDVLRGYGDRLRWVSEPDEGQGDAIAKGFRRTGGEILGWLNADDAYLPGAVSTAVATLLAHPDAVGVYGDVEFIDAAGARLDIPSHVEPFDRDRLLSDSDFIVQPATFFRRSAYESVGGLDRTLHYCLDYDLWIRMSRIGPFVHLRRPLAQVRLHAETKTASGGFARLAEIESMVGRHGRRRLPAGFQGQMVREAARALPGAVGRRDGRAVARAVRALLRYAIPTAVRRVARALRRTGRGARRAG